MTLVTLARSDEKFEKYLWGTFAKDQRAIAVETYHPFTSRERVTFRVESLTQIHRPPWWRVYLASARPEMWMLSLAPALSVIVFLRDQFTQSEAIVSLCALLALFFLHNAACLANDVQDHLTGSDRANRRRGSQVIQKGWASAREMYFWSWLNFIFAMGFGIPAVFLAPLSEFAIGLVALLGIFVLLKAWGARWGLSDLVVALIYGPLIVVGMTIAGSHSVPNELLALGVVWGGLTSWVLQSRQMENVFRSSREDHRTFMGYLNFENFKQFYLVESVVLLTAVIGLALYLDLPGLAWGLLPLAMTPMIWQLARLTRAASPLSSDFVRLGRHALFSHGVLSLWLLIGLSLL